MRHRHAAFITLFASLILPAVLLPLQAQVYKWTDTEGKVHYGSAPPPTPADAQTPQPLNIPSQPTPAGGVDNTSQMKRATQELRELRAVNRDIPVSELDRPRRAAKQKEPIQISTTDQARIDNLNSDIRRLSSSTFGTPASRAKELRAAKDELRQVYRKYGIKP
jgi:hypothetical protein